MTLEINVGSVTPIPNLHLPESGILSGTERVHPAPAISSHSCQAVSNITFTTGVITAPFSGQGDAPSLSSAGGTS